MIRIGNFPVAEEKSDPGRLPSGTQGPQMPEVRAVGCQDQVEIPEIRRAWLSCAERGEAIAGGLADLDGPGVRCLALVPTLGPGGIHLYPQT